MKTYSKFQINSVNINSFQQRQQTQKATGKSEPPSGFAMSALAYHSGKSEAQTRREYDVLIRKLGAEEEKECPREFIYKNFGFNNKKNMDSMFLEMQRKQEEIKEKAKTAQILIKCIKIAHKIIRGDNVPAKDDNFLFKNYPSMHLQAWTLRREKEKPEECKSELENMDDSGEVNVKVTSFTGDAAAMSIEMTVASLDVTA